MDLANSFFGRESLGAFAWCVVFYSYKKFIEPRIDIPSFKKEYERTATYLGLALWVYMSNWPAAPFENLWEYVGLCLLSLAFGLGFFYLSKFLEKQF